MCKKRKCINCEEEYPLTEEYFPKQKYKVTGTFRFLKRCRDCQTQYNTEMKRKQRLRDEEKGIKRAFK